MKITKQKIESLSPCDGGLEFATLHNFNAVEMWNSCQRGDWLIWGMRRTRCLDKKTAVKIAIACAEHVLDKFDKKYPKDNRPRLAIESAKEWLNHPNNKTAAAAYAAADAGAADAGAADAGAAAYGAAYAAAYAAAADAAYAAAAGAGAAAAADAAYAAAAGAGAADAADAAAAYAAAADAAYAAAAGAGAAAAADAAYAAAAGAGAADAADAAAAYAAADAGAADAERKWQADKIRELVKCPFTV